MALKALVVEMLGRMRGLERQVAAGDAEVARLKGLKGLRDIKPRGMERGAKPPFATLGGHPGRGVNTKTRRTIHWDQVVKAALQHGSRFTGDQDFMVQEPVLRAHVLRLWRKHWVVPNG
jgi:hypothetical protein